MSGGYLLDRRRGRSPPRAELDIVAHAGLEDGGAPRHPLRRRRRWKPTRYDNKPGLRPAASPGSRAAACRMGAITTGSYLLARAGLLKPATAAPSIGRAPPPSAKPYPDIEVSEELFEIDRDRLTCSGGTASLDLMLSLIGLEHGRELATKVAEQFIHERIRDTHDHQRMALRNRLGISHPEDAGGDRRHGAAPGAAPAPHPSWPSAPSSRPASSSACSASTSTARRPATTWSSACCAPATCSPRAASRSSTWRSPAASSPPPTSPSATASASARRRAKSVRRVGSALDSPAVSTAGPDSYFTLGSGNLQKSHIITCYSLLYLCGDLG